MPLRYLCFYNSKAIYFTHLPDTSALSAHSDEEYRQEFFHTINRERHPIPFKVYLHFFLPLPPAKSKHIFSDELFKTNSCGAFSIVCSHVLLLQIKKKKKKTSINRLMIVYWPFNKHEGYKQAAVI